MTEIELLNEQGPEILAITGWPKWEHLRESNRLVERRSWDNQPGWGREGWSDDVCLGGGVLAPHVALCIVKEHLRTWLWEKHRVRTQREGDYRWTMQRRVMKGLHASFPSLLHGDSFPTKLAALFAAVRAVKEKNSE